MSAGTPREKRDMARPGVPQAKTGARFEGFSKRIPQLDGLRGVCAVMIIIHHYALYLDPRGGWLVDIVKKSTGLFSVSVDMFFVLSGFLLGGILLENRTSKNYFKVFYARRFLRIVPLYMVLLGAFWMLKYGGGAALLHYPAGYLQHPYSLKYHFMMLQNLMISITGSHHPEFLIPTWTVAAEEQFYLILPLFIRWVPESRLPAVVACLIASAIIFRAAILFLNPFHFPVPWWGAYTLLPSRLDTLFGGVLMACLFRRQGFFEKLRQNMGLIRAALAVAAAGFCMMTLKKEAWLTTVIASGGYAWFSVMCCLLLAVCLADSRFAAFFSARPLCRLGNLSYFMYLFHVPFIGFFLRGAASGKGIPIMRNASEYAAGAAAVVCVWAVAVFSRRFFEGPLISLGRRLSFNVYAGERKTA